MKQRSLFLSLLCTAQPALGRGLVRVPVESSIAEVSLFRDGALVTRRGSVRVPAGRTSLVFETLPRDLDATTLHADFDDIAEGGGFVRNVKIRQVKDPDDDVPIVEEMKEKLDDASDEREKIMRLISEAKETIVFATSIRDSFAKEYGKFQDDGETHSIEKAKELAEFVSQTRAAAHEKIDSAQADLAETEKRIAAAKKEILEANEAAELLSFEAVVEIELEEAAEVTVSLAYLVSSAKWEPRYELRAYPEKGSLDIGYFASIMQHTGEDWSNITLSLQTNQANQRGNMPEMRPLHIKNLEGRLSRRERLVYHSDSSIEHSHSDMIERTEEYATITESTVSFQATIPGQVDVPSSREGSIYKVFEGSVEAEFWSESAPRLQLDAYLRAKILNTLRLPILPGNAIMFVDGKLSSRVRLEMILPEEEGKISLGPDGNLLVKRKKGALKDSDSGFYFIDIDKTKMLSREFVNEVTNLHRVDHKVVVVDQFPIARDERIKITRKEPGEGNVTIEDENNGIFQWEATLAPKEKRVFTTAFDVVHPRDWELSSYL